MEVFPEELVFRLFVFFFVCFFLFSSSTKVCYSRSRDRGGGGL